MNEIITVKYLADISTPNDYIGYLVNNTSTVPLDSNNRHTKEVEEWIADGGVVEEAYTQQELDDYDAEYTYAELMQQIDMLEVSFEGNIFSGSRDHQAFLVAMLQKIEGENPKATRNIYAINGRTKVPMTKTNMLDLMTAIDIEQEKITDA